MVNISQPKKVDEGSNFGGLGQILGAAAALGATYLTGGLAAPALAATGGTALGAGLSAAGAGAGLGGIVGGALSKPGSVEQSQGVQSSQNSGAMQRRLQDLTAPSQLQAPQADPGLEALRRRYGNMG